MNHHRETTSWNQTTTIRLYTMNNYTFIYIYKKPNPRESRPSQPAAAIQQRLALNERTMPVRRATAIHQHSHTMYWLYVLVCLILLYSATHIMIYTQERGICKLFIGFRGYINKIYIYKTRVYMQKLNICK